MKDKTKSLILIFLILYVLMGSKGIIVFGLYALFYWIGNLEHISEKGKRIIHGFGIALMLLIVLLEIVYSYL